MMNEFRHFPFMKNNEIYVRFFIGDKYVDLKLKEVEKLNKDLNEILAYVRRRCKKILTGTHFI